MKKLLAIVLALAMVLPMMLYASAVDFSDQWGDGEIDPIPVPDVFFGLDTASSSKTFIRGEKVEIAIGLKDVSLDGNIYVGSGRIPYEYPDGIGTLGLSVVYDKDVLAPDFAAADDGDGEASDMSAIVTAMPNGWVAFGKVDNENGIVDVAVSDENDLSALAIAQSGNISFKLTFTVNKKCTASEISVAITDIIAINADGKKECALDDIAVKIADATPSVIPANKVSLPSSAIALDYAGYKHANGVSSVYIADADTTVGAITEMFVGSVKDANSFGIAIFGDDGVVNYVNTTLGRPDGIKTDVPVKAGSTVIFVNAYAATEGANPAFEKFKESVNVGSIVTLYNINNEGFKYLAVLTELENAGFTVTNIQPAELTKVPEGAFVLDYAGYKHVNGVSQIYRTDVETTVGAITEKFVGSAKDANAFAIAIFGDDGKVTYVNTTKGRPDGVKTDVKVPAGSTIIFVNAYAKDGVSDNPDYAAFCEKVSVGSIITVYNINSQGFKQLVNVVELEKAAFTVKNYVELPASAEKINYIGYAHEGGATVVMGTNVDTTIGELVTKGDGATVGAEAPDMNYWGIVILDKEGVVTYVNNTLGRPDGVKTDVEVKAGYTVIGTHGSSEILQKIKIGDTVKVYNVDYIELASTEGHVKVDNAGFELVVKDLILKDGVAARYDKENGIIYIYEDKVEISNFGTRYFENFFDLYPFVYPAVAGNYVQNGEVFEYEGNSLKVIVMGDCNGDGIVTSRDYALIKRHCLGTYDLEGDDLEAAKIMGGKGVTSRDYANCKRVCLGTLTMADLMG